MFDIFFVRQNGGAEFGFGRLGGVGTVGERNGDWGSTEGPSPWLGHISGAGFVVTVNGDSIVVACSGFYHVSVSGGAEVVMVVTGGHGVAATVENGVDVGALVEDGDVIVTRSQAKGSDAFTCVRPSHLAELSDSAWTTEAAVVRLKGRIRVLIFNK